MTNKVFTDILLQGIRSGQMPERTKQAREWYREAAKNYGSSIRQGGTQAGRIDYMRVNQKKFINQDQNRLTSKANPGSMYMFSYLAKYADELPYWDRFPLVFPFNVQGDRMFGLNLHYLPLQLRAALMDELYTFANNQNYDQSTKLNFSYQALKAASRNKFFEPCVKQYLFSQMKSQFSLIYPSEWTIAAFLPLEKFTKKSKSSVWADTKQKLRV